MVLSIRGTLSLEDCLIDVLIDPQPLDDLGREHNFNGEGQYCHNGVLGCAKNIYKDFYDYNSVHKKGTILSHIIIY